MSGEEGLLLLTSTQKAVTRPFLPLSPIPALPSLPTEVLLKILSYLDAAALLCVGCVNRRCYHLANDK